MANYLKKLLTNKTYFVLFLMIIFFLPITLALPAQSEVRAIVIGLGIDLETVEESKQSNTTPDKNQSVSGESQTPASGENGESGSESANSSAENSDNSSNNQGKNSQTENFTNNYKLSAQIIIPTIDVKYNQNVQVVCATAPTVMEGIDKINLILGKEIGLTHCSVVILGDSVAEKGVTEIMDFLVRSSRLNANTVLVNTNSAYELLMASSQLDNGISFSLQNILEFNDRLVYSADISLEEFYKNMIQHTKSNYVGRVDVVKTEVDGIEVNQESKGSGGESASSGGGSSGSGGSGQGTQSISNVGKTALFKGGKKIGELQENEIKGYKWISPVGTEGAISVSDLYEKPYKNGGGCVVNIENKLFANRYRVKGVTPVVESHLTLIVKIEEVTTNAENENNFNNGSNSFITDEVKKKIIEKITDEINLTVQKCKQYNCDIFGVVSAYEKYRNGEFKKLIKFYGSEEEFFQATQFDPKITIKGIT